VASFNWPLDRIGEKQTTKPEKTNEPFSLELLTAGNRERGMN